ncbi:MAG: hypothetical protein FWD82_01245 [Defluviitaleaceae bacterium]|nr:hypothetical protein [Defluviitaleaceae bacterium]
MINIIRKYAIIIISAMIFLALIIVIAALNFRFHNQINNTINNPTFVGEVIGKYSSSHTILIPRTQYSLHIIGEYIGYNEIIQVDKVFIVSRSIYNRFSIGDIIYHE